MKELVQEVKHTLLDWGFTISKDYWDLFIDPNSEIRWGNYEPVTIKFKGKIYGGTLWFKNRQISKGGPCLQLTYGSDLKIELKKEFTSSFFFFEGERFVEQNKKHFSPELPPESKEFLSVSHKDNMFIFKTFLKHSTIFDNIFTQFIKKDLFGWFNKHNDSEIISYYSDWLDISELNKYSQAPFIIYCLVSDSDQQFYIGRAQNLGKRVHKNRSEIPNWNRFMYAEVHPDFREYQNELEYFAINLFARFFKNKGKIKHLNICGYTQVNKDYTKKYSKK